jgi:predicted SAM-dependent methyltransferase
MNKLPYLNLGCGVTFHKSWTNIDFVAEAEEVIAHNLLDGIPVSDNHFQVVYHSHILEHFSKTKAKDFMKECYRVLKPGGTLRVVIPDLEMIALNYVKYLNESLQGVPGAEQKYNWTMLELFDQVARTQSGGEMVNYIRDTTNNNDAFLFERNGHEVERIISMIRGDGKNTDASHTATPPANSLWKGISKRIKNKSIQLVLGKDYEAYKVGKFRSGGEVHQWMYDRYSLKRLFEETGFKNAQVKSAFESTIPEWSSFNLDAGNGVVRKPDSLFMEAIK